MRAPAVTAQPGRASPAGRLLAVNFTACILLVIQCLLGMAAIVVYLRLQARREKV